MRLNAVLLVKQLLLFEAASSSQMWLHNDRNGITS